MTYSLKYIEDSKGRHRAVQLSIADWKKIQKKLHEAELIVKLRSDFTESFESIRQHQQGKKRLKTLDELLAEL